jgi:hypothetical protein
MTTIKEPPVTFSCINEIEIRGGTEEERAEAAKLVFASDSADEDSGSSRTGDMALVLRFESVDGLPEAELAAIAAEFPGLSLTLAYFSLDGEFYGYARAGAGGEAAESEDFEEGTREEVGKDHDGDGIAFVKARYGLERAG